MAVTAAVSSTVWQLLPDDDIISCDAKISCGVGQNVE
jgi:hypothetical protein